MLAERRQQCEATQRDRLVVIGSHVLITGAGGFLGGALCQSVPADWRVTGAIRSAPAPMGVAAIACELTDPRAVRTMLVTAQPSLVIHCAYSHDRADIVDATAVLATACAAAGIGLIAMSTDVVFGGDRAPYGESDLPDPIIDYGRAKRDAEGLVTSLHHDATIVRTSLIIGRDVIDPASRWLVEANRRGEMVTMFSDEVRTPILVEDLCVGIWELASMPASERAGIWHLVGPDRLSRTGLGSLIARWFDLDATLIRAATQSSAGVCRPRDVSLVSSRSSGLSSFRPRSLDTVQAHGSDS